MDRHHHTAFHLALTEMAAFFVDPLTPQRQQVYWELCGHLPLDAWQYACREAMATQVLPRCPLPAVLLGFAAEFAARVAHRLALDGPLPHPPRRQDPEAGGVVAIRAILRSLRDVLATKHPVYQAPTTEDPEVRKARLLEQAAQVMAETNGQKG